MILLLVSFQKLIVVLNYISKIISLSNGCVTLVGFTVLINFIEESKLMDSKDCELGVWKAQRTVVSKDDGMNFLDKNSNRVQ